ncbi:fungal specific transcription factor domain-containing protein [Colletotrichum scovillei]|uniref:Fungal specific transcription factor domain-containing protein n=1 Tax=Colletotrichum scovillei TaxID=1209932 RepID=A0A9P7UDP0_9PEZI|nr:fungal specific transcription factor domain-containing protein [Colletotrichum scovillei]KAG7070967.1 fungal specific transcription factor domain-containing protein [Colletotrichum scovillei]KAG7079211.1 fungal specific transcription factor domain-containing protein [Colletotrichum scovillei]
MKIKREVGPLDHRRRRTRCQPCARRRIKCQGGPPCEYCTRTKKSCLPQATSTTEVHFINPESSEEGMQVARLLTQVNLHSDILYLDYFDLFMKRCLFTDEFNGLAADLLPLTQTCLPLVQVVTAIGALEASRRATVRSSRYQQSPYTVAFLSYGEAMKTLRARLQVSDAFRCGGVLWCTLLLGLFELMTETSGDMWAKHMLYGTARIIQSIAATSRSCQLDKRLFGAFRSLEANRAILYGENTFLSQEPWLKSRRELVANPGSQVETIFDLLIEISSFSKAFFDRIESVSDTLRPGHPAIHALAERGRCFQQRLRSCHDQMTPRHSHNDPYCMLAISNNHALQLFLCKNYTFYACWEGQDIPSLAAHEIEAHVNAVSLQKDEIMRLLDRIATKGFAVSGRIKRDLQELWEYQHAERAWDDI